MDILERKHLHSKTISKLLTFGPLWLWGIVLGGIVAILLYLILSWFSLFPQSAYPIANIPLLLIIVIGGLPLGGQILLKILKGNFGADSLAVIALITALSLGEYLAGVLVILMLAGGQALEEYALVKASSVLHELAKRMPLTAHRRTKDTIEEIALSHVGIGDHLVIYPHETVPVDGIVLDGHGSMDESYLTGEPYHVSKTPGVGVLSGSINGESVLVIQAEKRAIDSRYAKIMQVMEEAEQKRPQIRRLGDQIGALFAPISLIFAMIAWYFTGSAMNFLAVLVVATPCPLLIAIPITLISAISLAARHRIIIKDPTVLEQLPTCKTVLFDKTGTLTYGQPKLTKIITAPGINRQQVLQWVASLERYSKHPLASPIMKAAEKANLTLLDAQNVYENPGQGLIGSIDGHTLMITHRSKLQHMRPDFMELLPSRGVGLECVILQNGAYVAIFQFQDTPRQNGKFFISHLTPVHQFQKIILLSGDQETEVSNLAKQLGITKAFSSQSPEQKLDIIRAETKKAPTLFMGDGINDAPGLTAATVGIAFGHHNAITFEAAGAVILDSSLEKVDTLLHISAMMRRIMLQSALGGMGLSLIAMGFAAMGFIPPVMGALLQEIIDGIAIINALRLTWFNHVEIDLP